MILKNNNAATLELMKERRNRMVNVKSLENIKTGGCLRALDREIRNLENKIG